METFRIIDDPAASGPVKQTAVLAPRERRQQASPLAADSPEISVLLKSMFRCVGLIIVGWGFILVSVSVLDNFDPSGDCPSNASAHAAGPEVQIPGAQAALSGSASKNHR